MKKKKKSLLSRCMCSSPNLAVKLPGEGGKSIIRFMNKVTDNIAYLEYRFGKENVLKLPCGNCPDCKASYSYRWSVRSMMELQYHKEACFVTFTYDDANCPKELNKKDLQDFWKLLRHKYEHIRYLCCGEYGSKTLRPHYHAIIFGYFPKDAKPFYKNGLGQTLYKSAELDKLWNKGIVQVGDVDKDSCAYVAGYTSKKDNPLKPGFVLSSRKPPLGYQFIVDNAVQIMKNGCLLVPGIGTVAATRFEFDILDKLGYDISLAKEASIKLLDDKFNARMINNGFRYKDEQARSSIIKKTRKRGL